MLYMISTLFPTNGACLTLSPSFLFTIYSLLDLRFRASGLALQVSIVEA